MTGPGGTYDAIVVGGGHNGLVAACYLARAGRKVALLEAGRTFGGAAVTEELSPGYMAPRCAHMLESWPRGIERDLKLARHGFEFAVRDMATVALDPYGRHLVLNGTTREDRQALRDWSEHDATAYPVLRKDISRYAALLAPLIADLPPDGGYEDTIRRRMTVRLGAGAERLGRARLRTLLQRLPASVGDMLDATLETDLLKGALAVEAVEGRVAGPRSPGTVFSLVYREAMRRLGGGRCGYPKGGVGGLTRALANAAEHFGVDLRLGTRVAEILVQDGAVSGVRLSDGRRFGAPVVLSTADPKQTFLDLVGARHFGAGLAARIGGIRMRGTTAKVNLALQGLPSIAGFTDREYGGRWLIAKDLRTVERAFVAFKQRDFAKDPVMELVLPSYHDPDLAPPGHHVMSVTVHYVPYDLAGGWNGAQHERLLQNVVDTIERYAPGFKELVVAGELLTPVDIERRFRLPQGDWAHGQMMPDQLMMFRPAPGLGHHRTPLRGLYFGGAGAHPGGGITGLPGKLAAHAALGAKQGTRQDAIQHQ